MKPVISLIVSIYNNVKALELVLSSLSQQSFSNFEVRLSDDGSNPASVSEINKLMSTFAFPIKHIWHPDRGWNKNTILNKSIMATTTPYIVFIDGDCLLHQHFMMEHYSSQELQTVLTGRRVHLSSKISGQLTTDLIASGYLENKILLNSYLTSIGSNSRSLEQGWYIKSKAIRQYLNRKDKGVLGSNFSVSKQNLLDINGFDERFVHPAAGEDTDIEARFRRNGLSVKTIRNQAIQYHLFHKQLGRDPERLKYLDENNANKITYTPFGIDRNR
ncbi:MAG: glycosyltransferase [Pseudomonadales bacterium]|nr:glycosyltransferase [Pseudomonadales bacterium]